MKLRLAVLGLFTAGCLTGFAQMPQKNSDAGAYIPPRSSAERTAILDALRGDQQIIFKVNYLKVHRGWAWVDTTPLDKQGKAVAEGGPNLLHLEEGKWKVLDLTKVPEDPNDPLGPEDASPTFVKNLIKTFPGAPRDIFPKPTK
jgi:hypothetical protein